MSELDDCKKYDNLMSLKLDGLLDAEKERVFDSHVARCPQCAPRWEAMVETDKMLWGWVSEPLPVPANFHVKVMARVATSPITHMQVAPAYAGIAVPQPTRPLPILPNTGPLTGGLTGPLTMRLTELQGRIAPYVRWIAAGVLAVASMAGLIMALVVSGVLTFEGEMAGVWVGGNGQNGHVVVRAAPGADRIHLNGAVGAILLRACLSAVALPDPT
jgi:anti-sigma factor RsiW